MTAKIQYNDDDGPLITTRTKSLVVSFVLSCSRLAMKKNGFENKITFCAPSRLLFLFDSSFSFFFPRSFGQPIFRRVLWCRGIQSNGLTRRKALHRPPRSACVRRSRESAFRASRKNESIRDSNSSDPAASAAVRFFFHTPRSVHAPPHTDCLQSVLLIVLTMSHSLSKDLYG